MNTYFKAIKDAMEEGKHHNWAAFHETYYEIAFRIYKVPHIRDVHIIRSLMARRKLPWSRTDASL